MDELVRKIYHYRECKSLRKELQTLREYLDFQFSDVDTSGCILPTTFPILIETNSQISADKLSFELSRKLNLPMRFISLSSDYWQKQLNEKFSGILYLTDFHSLKKSAKENLIKYIEDKKCILVSFVITSYSIHYTKLYENKGNTKVEKRTAEGWENF